MEVFCGVRLAQNLSEKAEMLGQFSSLTRPLAVRRLAYVGLIAIILTASVLATAQDQEEELEGGEIEVGLMFTSDGTVLAKGFVLLEDDKGMQPAENIAPVVRKEIVDAYGDDFRTTLNDVSKRLTTAELVSLNKFVGIDGQDPEEVAAEWLTAIGVAE